MSCDRDVLLITSEAGAALKIAGRMFALDPSTVFKREREGWTGSVGTTVLVRERGRGGAGTFTSFIASLAGAERLHAGFVFTETMR